MKITILLCTVASLLVNLRSNATCSLQSGTSYALPAGSTGPSAIAFSPSGSYVAIANDNSNDVTVFQISGGGTLNGGTSYALPAGSTHPFSVAFSPNGTYVATANYFSSDVTVFTVGAGETLSGGTSYALLAGSNSPYSVAFSPDGTYVATANGSNNVIVFTVGSGGALSNGTSYTLPAGSTPPISIAFSPDGTYLATANSFSGSTNGSVTVFTVGVGGVLSNSTSYALPAGSIDPVSVAFSPSGAYLATANGAAGSTSGDVTVFTVGAGGVLSNGTSYALPAGSRDPNSVAFSPDGSYLVTANNFTPGSSVTVFTVGAGGALSNGTSYALPAGSVNPESVAFSPSGAYVTTANYGSNDVTIFDILGCVTTTTTTPTTTTTFPITTTPRPTTISSTSARLNSVSSRVISLIYGFLMSKTE